MLVLQETTLWPFPLHVYFTDNSKSKIFAYINAVTGEGKIFSKPMGFETRGRSFEVIKEFELDLPGIPVKGSKGDVYYVTEEDGNYKCTCVGFKYHGTCKHIEKVINERGTN